MLLQSPFYKNTYHRLWLFTEVAESKTEMPQAYLVEHVLTRPLKEYFVLESIFHLRLNVDPCTPVEFRLYMSYTNMFTISWIEIIV